MTRIMCQLVRGCSRFSGKGRRECGVTFTQLIFTPTVSAGSVEFNLIMRNLVMKSLSVSHFVCLGIKKPFLEIRLKEKTKVLFSLNTPANSYIFLTTVKFISK